MAGEAYPRPPLIDGANRPRHKPAAAIRTDVENLGLDAGGAEGAFVGADARIERIGWQVLVAIFAIGSKLQRHGVISRCKRMIADGAADSNGGYPSICATQGQVFKGSFELSFSRSSTIEERTWATL